MHEPDAAVPIAAPIKGRGTPVRIAHRFERVEREAVDDGWERDPADGDEAARRDGAPPLPATTVREEHVKTLLSRNDSPDIPFDLAINPYRGCEHDMWNSSLPSTPSMAERALERRAICFIGYAKSCRTVYLSIG